MSETQRPRRDRPSLEPGRPRSPNTALPRTFDAAPLRTRASRADWKRFRAEAIRGEHGTDLAEHRWWKRRAFALNALGYATAFACLPVVLLAVPRETRQEMGAAGYWTLGAFPAAIALAALFGFWLPRRELWGPRARRHLRLERFARLNGLEYDGSPEIDRPAPDVFSAGAADLTRDHFDRLSMPGRFAVANYREVDHRGFDEATSQEIGYVVFALRESYPPTVATRTKWLVPHRLRQFAPLPGPAGSLVWSRKPEYPLLRRLLDSGVLERALRPGRGHRVEVIGDELFVLRVGGYLPIDSPGFWEWCEAVARDLAPFLAEDVPGAAPRDRAA